MAAPATAPAADRTTGPSHRFRVVWQDPDTRHFHHVADLRAEHGDYTFTYADAQMPPSFRPFPAFPDLRAQYRSPRLFPFFANRVMSARRPDYDDHLAALGLTRDEAEPLELLARSAGRRATDTVQVVPERWTDEHGRAHQLFLASGARHVPGAEERIRRLRPGAILTLRPQPDDAGDPRALLLDTGSGEQVGWVPSYLLDEVHEDLDGGAAVTCVVEQANGPDVPWHLRLLCRLITVPGTP